MKAKRHPTETPRGQRDPRECLDQSTASKLVYLITIPGACEREPRFYTDRAHKFEGHIRRAIQKPGIVIEDIKWKQRGGLAWWRIPAWPDGRAES